MGNIGRNTARKARAFGFAMQYHNRTRLGTEVEAELGVAYVSLEQLLATSDILYISLPLSVRCARPRRLD
jgi:lactate dehydrogenase-like 2-hydroxyacid dehydrogenase